MKIHPAAIHFETESNSAQVDRTPYLRGKINNKYEKSNFEYIRRMLSKKTKYGIKALVFIAREKEKKPIKTSEIARSENISQKFLESILLELRKSGFLGSKKGKGGGYYLLKEPENINMTAVIRALEGPIAMVPCVSLNYYEKCDDCENEKTCAVNRLMVQVRDSTLKILEKNTLADISAKK